MLLCIEVLEKSIILRSKKYIEWKVQFYLETCRIFEEFKDFKKAKNLLQRGLNSFPSDNLDNNKKINKCRIYFEVLLIKYKLFLGEIPINDLISQIKIKIPAEMQIFGFLESLMFYHEDL